MLEIHKQTLERVIHKQTLERLKRVVKAVATAHKKAKELKRVYKEITNIVSAGVVEEVDKKWMEVAGVVEEVDRKWTELEESYKVYLTRMKELYAKEGVVEIP